MPQVMDCGFEVWEFELQSRYYIHIRIYHLGKGIDLPISQAMSLIISLLFYKDGFGIE